MLPTQSSMIISVEIPEASLTQCEPEAEADILILQNLMVSFDLPNIFVLICDRIAKAWHINYGVCGETVLCTIVWNK